MIKETESRINYTINILPGNVLSCSNKCYKYLAKNTITGQQQLFGVTRYRLTLPWLAGKVARTCIQNQNTYSSTYFPRRMNITGDDG